MVDQAPRIVVLRLTDDQVKANVWPDAARRLMRHHDLRRLIHVDHEGHGIGLQDLVDGDLGLTSATDGRRHPTAVFYSLGEAMLLCMGKGEGNAS